MADFLVVATLVAFFALCVAFVRACDRIIGPDETSDLRDVDEVDTSVTA